MVKHNDGKLKRPSKNGSLILSNHPEPQNDSVTLAAKIPQLKLRVAAQMHKYRRPNRNKREKRHKESTFNSNFPWAPGG